MPMMLACLSEHHRHQWEGPFFAEAGSRPSITGISGGVSLFRGLSRSRREASISGAGRQGEHHEHWDEGLLELAVGE